jgi:hypothetical protein
VFAESLFIDTQGVQTRFDPKVTLIIPAAYYQLSDILFDGRPIASVLRPSECNPVKDCDGNIRAYICRFCVPDGVSLGDHTVEHTNPRAIFGIIIYGYERENTYGYVGGMDLNPLAVTTFCFDGLDVEANEGDGIAGVRIQRTGPTKERACITMECSDGTAMAGTHYEAFNGECCFEAGSSLATCNVSIIDNDVCGDPDRQLTCRLKPDDDQMACEDVATVTIKNDDEITVELTEDTFRVQEDVGSVEVCVKMSGCQASEDLNLKVKTKDSSQDFLLQEESVLATANSDYSDDDLDYVIPAGQAEATVCKGLPIINDFDVEQKECLNIELCVSDGTSGVTVMRPNGTVCIQDDDVDIMIMFKVEEMNVTEGDGVVEVCLMSDHEFPTETTINLSLEDCEGDPCEGSATGGEDYESGEYMVVFGAGDTRACVEIPIEDDDVLEKTECFKVNYNIPEDTPGVMRSTDGPNELTVNIIENDVLCVMFKPVSYSVQEEAGLAQLMVMVNISSQCPFDVQIVTEDGTANAPSDYISHDNTPVQFPALATSVKVDVIIIDDEELECPENFTTRIVVPEESAECGVVVHDNQGSALVTIEPDPNDNIVVNFVDDSPVMVTEGMESVTVMLMLTGTSEYPVTVKATPQAGTASAPGDFSGEPVMVTFAPGETKVSITIPLGDDGVSEPNESFSIVLMLLMSCPGVSIGETALQVVVKDNDPVVCGWDPVKYMVEEPDGEGKREVEKRIVCNRNSSVPFTIFVSTADGTATSGEDYEGIPEQAVTFQPGTTSATVVVNVEHDEISEGDETFFCKITTTNDTVNSGVDVSIVVDTAMVTIVDSDIIRCCFSPVDYLTGEMENATLMIMCSGVATFDYVVMVTTQQQTAMDPNDYVGGTYSVTIPAGQTTAKVNVPVIDDSIMEGNETFKATLVVSDETADMGIHPKPNTSMATVEIIDDDEVTCRFERRSYSAEESEGKMNISVVCEGEFSVPFDVEVPFTSMDAVDGEDFDGTTQVITFQPGVSSITVSVPITDDDIAECDEDFGGNLKLPERSKQLGVKLGEPDRAVLTITDEDTVTCMFAGEEGETVIPESVNASLMVMLSGSASTDITCVLTTMDITATDGMDYTRGSYQATFSPGETKKNIIIPSIDDIEPERRECYRVTLSTTEESADCGAEVGERNEKRVCLIDNDAVTVEFDPDEYEVDESDGGVKVFVKTSNTAVRDFMIQIECSDGTAKAGMDFDSGPHPVTIPAGSMGAMVTIPIQDDGVYEGPERFTCRIIADSSTGITAGEKDTATIDIGDDDCVEFSVDKYCIDLDSGEATGVIRASIELEQKATALVYTVDKTTGQPVGLGEEGRTVEVTFEPGDPGEKEFAVSVEEGDLVRYLPLDLVNPDCEPQARTNEDGDYIIPPPPTTEPPPTSPPKYFVSASFDLQMYTMNPSENHIRVNVSLNDTASEDLCLRIATQDGSATGSVHYQGGKFSVPIAEGRSKGVARIPVITERITEQVFFSANLELCSGVDSETKITIDRGRARAVIPHPLDKPTCPSVAPTTITASPSPCPVTTTITPPPSSCPPPPDTTCPVSTLFRTETVTVDASCPPVPSTSCPVAVSTTTTTVVSIPPPGETSCPVTAETTTVMVTPEPSACPPTEPPSTCEPETFTQNVTKRITDTETEIVTQSVTQRVTDTQTEILTTTSFSRCPSTTPCPSPSSTCPPTPPPRPCRLGDSCYNRTMKAKEACTKDFVAVVKTSNVMSMETCTYRVHLRKILRGTPLIAPLTAGKFVNVQFPLRDCIGNCGEPYDNGCIVLSKDRFHLLGAHVRVDHRGPSLVADLPVDFITDQHTSKLVNRMSNLPACVNNN